MKTGIQTIALTRRTFVASSCAAAGVMLMPGSLMAGPTAGAQVGASPGLSSATVVTREFANDRGVARPYAWRSSNGASLEFIDASHDGTEFRISHSVGGDETFLAQDLQLGRPQELVRQRFGDGVLNELMQEVDRRRSVA